MACPDLVPWPPGPQPDRLLATANGILLTARGAEGRGRPCLDARAPALAFRGGRHGRRHGARRAPGMHPPLPQPMWRGQAEAVSQPA